ncbi:PucR family transcriptional regulator ligand-binding domain-containing protein [Nocardiopsis sp. N85]|uniref:PucR family transcriptional regulator n=1 Tax=Nocardiopsis sp. N85 TaxID=3029400 RepID=UPI00237F2B4F|nr:PucR family transcriptional regulator [Nocardiopsis sp. N85]MDE3722249.1 PucR family transcriptional regulator ligand-binding domain-containing protein [Nocardiopsis sp. N85]
MRLDDLIAVERLHLRFLVGAEQADREVRWAYTTDLLEPARYLRGGELVLTGMMWHGGPEAADRFVASVVAAGAVAIGAGTALGAVPEDLVEACRRRGMPLVEVPPETSFGAVTEEVLGSHTRRRFAGLARHRDRLRQAVAEVAAGADFAEVFARASAQVGVRAWVISSTGRLVAGDGEGLGAGEREWLASRALSWPLLPHTTRVAGAGETVVTVRAVATSRSHPLSRWLLVCAGDEALWGEEERETVAELESVAVLARGRLEERWSTEARHLEGVARLLAAQRFDEVAALLRGTPEGEGEDHVVISAVMLPTPRSGELTRHVVAELVAGSPGAVVTGDGDGDTLALVPVPAGEATRAAEGVRAALVAGARVLEGGLLDHRLALGSSSAARGVPELRGAAVEARHARRLAELRGGRWRVIAGAEIDSHELLLASVPEEVQSSYRERLLGPLIAYDRDHRSELVETLERFLEHSGSWQRCAAAMHVHVNTLRYRIGRVEELTGRDLSELEHRVDLFLALKLRD